MDQHQHLATLLLRCFARNLTNYRIIASKDDNNFYLIQESSVVELVHDSHEGPVKTKDFDPATGKFSVARCLDNVQRLGVRGTIDYFICTGRRVTANQALTTHPHDLLLSSLYKVKCNDSTSVNVYVSEASELDFELELQAFCDQHQIEVANSGAVLGDFFLYLKKNIQYLTERGVTGTLFYLLLRQYGSALNFNSECRYCGTWADVTSDEPLTVVDGGCEAFLRQHTVGAVVRRAKSKCDLENVYKNLWLSNEVSLLLRVDSPSDFLNLSNILATFSLPARVTVTSNCLAVLKNDANVQNRLTINAALRSSTRESNLIRALSEQSVCSRPLPAYYVERNFLKVILSLDALRELDEEFFLVRSKVPNGKQLFEGSVKKKLSNVRVVEDGDCETPTSVPAHLVNFYGHDWVEWKETLGGGVENLRPYNISASTKITCQLPALLQEQRKAMVVVGGAGLGKSLLLSAVANSLPKDSWVEMVDLTKNPNPDIDDVVLRHFLVRKRLHVLIDGFDQAPSLQSLEQWSKLECKLWIVTRPANAPPLEKHLNSFSVELRPFSVKNRQDFLIGYFGTREFVDHLLKIFVDVFADFTLVPLHLHILADVFEEHHKKFLMSGILDLEVIDVLEGFLKKRTELICTRYADVAEELRAFMEHCSLWALGVVFDEGDLSDVGIGEKMQQLRSDKVLSILASEGMVENARFKHDIFNEYLAAKWIFTNRVVKLLRRRFSDRERFAGVFTMLDYALAKDCALHTSLIQGKAYMVQLQLQPDLKQLDAGRRSLAHIAALYGKHHPKVTNNAPVDIADNMVSIIKLSDEKLLAAEDTLLGYNPLDCALAAGTLAVANAICERLPNISTTVFLDLPDLETYFDYCTKVNSYRHLYRYLIKYSLIRLLMQNEITPNSKVYVFVTALQVNEMIGDLIQEYLRTLDASLVIHLLEGLQLKTPDVDIYSDLHLACAYGTVDNVAALIIDGAMINKLRMYTPLHVAVIHKRLDTVNLLLSFGAKINSRDAAGNTPLHLACQIYSNTPIVEKLLQHNAIPDLANTDGDTPMHCALKANLPNVARLFLPKVRRKMLLSARPGDYSQTIDLNARNNDGNTPLLLAIERDQTLLAHELVRSYANVDIVSKSGHSCLHHAAGNKSGTALTKQIDSYVHLNGRNEDGETPLLVAIKTLRTDVAQVLMAKGADVNVSDKNFVSCLHYAVVTGRTQIVLDLLERGADINQKNNSGLSPLMHAIVNGYPNAAVLLIERGADVNAVDLEGSTALHHAAYHDKHHVIRALLSRGAQKDPRNNDGDTPLLVALKNLFVNAVRTLLSLGADVGVRDRNGSTCLHLVTLLSHLDIVRKILAQLDVDCLNVEGNTPLLISLKHMMHRATRLFLDNGADVFVTNKSGHSAVHYAAKSGSENFLSEFIRRGADVNQKTKSGETPLLLHVMEYSRRGVVKLLTDNGANVSVVDPATGNSCLHYLVKHQEDDIIGDVVRAGAGINVQNRNGDTPLHFAIRFSNLSTVQVLLGLGADPNVADYGNGSTCLHWAVIVNEDDYVQALVQNGADVNKVNNDGETPLDRARRFGYNNISRIITESDGSYRHFASLCRAVKRGEIFTVKKLLGDDFDIDKKNDDGETLLMSALEHGEVGIADYLIARGASLSLRNNRGFSTLHYAANVGDIVNVRRHLENGVDIDAIDINGDTPLIIACYSKNRHVVELLLRRGASVELSPMSNPKQTCLYYAVEGGWDDVVSHILDRGFYVDKRSARGSTAFLKAISCKNAHIAMLLLESGADVMAEDESRATCLHLAAVEGMIDMVQVLLEKNVNVNVRDSRSDTPLMNAIECQNHAVSKLLLSEPTVDVHVENMWCYMLHQAAYAGFDDVVLAILDQGFDIDKENVTGDTALMVALAGRNIETAKILWRRGARIDVVNSKTKNNCLDFAVEAGYEDLVRELLKRRCLDESPDDPLSISYNYNIYKMQLENILGFEHLDDRYEFLHFAATLGDLGIMSALLDRGLDINLQNQEGETPLLVAARKSQWAVADLLLSRGAEVHTVENHYERSCMHYVAASAEEKLLLVLLEKGCEVNAQQFDETTPLIEAIKQKRYSMVKLLLAHGADANIVYADGRTALHYASETDSKILLAVIDKIVDVDKRSNDNETALMVTLQQGNFDLTRIILEHGATDLTIENGNTFLHYVVEMGDLEFASWIIDKFGNIDAVNAEGNTPLMLAFKHEQEEVLKLLLQRGADVRVANNDGCSIIHFAASSAKNLALVIDEDGVNKKNGSGQTPLLIALSGGYTSNALALVQHGADVFVEDNNGNTCLHLAVTGDDEVLMQALIEKGLDVNKKNKEGEDCLQVAIENSCKKVTKTLLGVGGDPNTVSSSSGRTALINAIELGDEVLWTQLLEQDADINAQTNSGLTPLLAAMETGRSDLAKLLIAKGCDVSIRRRNGSCLHAAVEHRVDVVGELLEAGLDVDQQDENGFTPLSVALKCNNADAVVALLNSGADLNLRNNDGVPCLHYAVATHEEHVVSLLLAKGASVNERSSCGNTPLLYALKHEKLDNARLMLTHGASFDVRNCKGNSCLYYAAKAGYDGLVEEFLEKGDEVDKFNYRGFTPFVAALRCSQVGTAKLLLKKGADPNVQGHYDLTCLEYVIATDDVELAEIVTEKGADVVAGLWSALREGRKNMVDFFVSRGANLHSIDCRSEDSFLHLAAGAGFDDTVVRLLDAGLDPNRHNNFQETPLRLALANGHFTTAKLLLSRGATPSPHGNFKYSYLHYAVQAGETEIALDLIARGIDVDCKSEDGDAPVFLALMKRKVSTAKVLLERGADVFGLSSEGHGLLHYAAEANADDVRALLVEKGLVDDS